MKIKSILENDVLLLDLNGRLDSIASEELDQFISKKEGFKLIKLDFKNVEYISSTGLRVLLKYQKLYSEMELYNINGNVKDVLKMTGFDKILNIK